ncbi:PIR protein CIR protein [Plasmodium vinckei lentum]|uniref:PIR protein CIR protein n=1 Tax=Plasmodium vinckei lentum TaxID=138297 RepID=A0A6V7SLT0_PLAVN|nr:PIR protein CIR protein [Plasmodium vinckei lentum]
MSKQMCKTIQYVNVNITFDPQSQNYKLNGGGLDEYCPSKKGDGTGQCNNNDQRVSSAFIGLLNLLNGNNDEENIERGKLAEYAVLWLSYKLNQKTENGDIKLNDFYTKNIKTNTNYNMKINSDNDNMIDKDLIDNKIKSINMYIKDISNFYEAFEVLCKMYNTCNEKNKDCPTCSKNAKEFVEKFETLNDASDHKKSAPYSQILLTLSNDYHNLKNYCAQNCSECSDVPSLPDIKISQNHIESSLQTSEVTSSSSLIASKLIPGLLIFSAIPVFLGIAYKTILKRKDKKNKEENESLYMIRRSDYSRNSNND